ncbi:hypothetical protein EK21DRAFT_95114 [Setomelanomma holmii]|uniref:Uncharacterized protein n=1 Tax=Setomelanomma holmii TaxID=210430 RepID=A0A9P4GXA1_9PLEO|nr:hypothetical protein EK21DRAFT_95114 [Setomelanomma holmii]
MSKTSVTPDIVLQGQRDVWEYIDPNQIHHPLQKPEKPVRPAPTVNADGSPPTQPTQQALLQYNQDLSNYYKEIKEYRRQRDKISSITSKTSYLYTIKSKTLQDLYSPTTSDQEYRVQKAYEAAKVLHARRSNIEDWCSEFLIAYNRAKQLNLLEVNGFRAHKDLVRAIKLVDAAYAGSASLNIFKAEEMWHSNHNVPIPSQSQLSTILADFLRYHRTTHSRKTNIHGAADKTGILNKIQEKNQRYKKQRSKDADKPAKSDSIEVDAGDQPTDRSPHEAYAVFSSAFNNQSSLHDYPLLHSWTLDPATDIHICNNPAEFHWKAPAADDDIVLAGGSETIIEAWGEVTIPLSTPNGIKTTTLKPQYSALPLKPRLLTKPQLHVLLGHAGSNAIDQLSSHVRGILPPTGAAPATINCKECLQNKSHQIISRRIGHELGASPPFETVAIDLIQLDVTAYNGHRYVFHGFDLYTKLNFVYTIAKRDKATLLKVIRIRDVTFKENLFYQHRDESDPLLQGEELKTITYTLYVPTLQDLEDSSEDEYSTIPELDQVVSSPPLDTRSKPHNAYNSDPHLPTPAATISPYPDTQSGRSDQASSTTRGRSPTLDFQSTQASRKRKRRDLRDSNAAQRRELIDSNLRATHILPEGSTRSRKRSRKGSSFLISKY